MSSLRAHFRNHAQQPDDPTTTLAPKHTSRIPTKSVAPEGGKLKKPVQHVSKLAKRPSKNITSPEPSRKSSTTRTATPVTAVAQNTVGSSRGTSVPPSGSTVPAAPPNMRTPSLVSGSSVSTFDSPRSALRRKPSGAIDKYAAQKRAESTGAIAVDRAAMHRRNETSREVFDDTVLGISLPPTFPYDDAEHSAGSAQDLYDEGITRDFTPPIYAGYAPSATPSTRDTDSPFSHAPTPSSASSYSPGLLVTTTNVPRSRLSNSPTRSRPPVSGRPQVKEETSRLGLPPVRESSTSSSNSTVRPEVKLAHARKEQSRKAQNALSPTVSNDEHTASSNTRRPKDVSSSSNPSIQVPPELAHLNVEPPTSTSLTRSPPPSRPSREGTSTIADMSSPSPVVQSDLPRLYTTYHKRTPSQETPVSASSPSFKSRFGFSSRSSSRNESRIDSAISPPPAARNFHRRATPEVQPHHGAKLQRKDSPAVSAPGTAKAPRFGFFSRKSKGESTKAAEKPKRQPSKGPAAGTGHEGYGRFGVRGRSGSMSSSAGFRSPSSESGRSSAARPPLPTARKSSVGSKDGSEIDDFLRERLTPVILRGSGSTFSNTASSSDLPGTSLHPASSKSSSLDSIPAPQLLPSAMSESRDQSPMKRPPLGRRLPSDSSDDMSARYPSLAARRSLTRMSSNDSRSSVRLPPPINTNLPPQHPSVDSYDAETSAWPQTDSSLPPGEDAFHGREGQWLASPTSDSPVKTSRKWNFFQRVTASPRGKGKERAVESSVEPDAIARQPPYRNVVHYGMLGPVEPIGLEEVERIAQENETSADDSLSESNGPNRMVPYERRHTSLLPSPPKRGYSSDSDFRAKPLPPRIMVERQDSSESQSPELLRAQPAFAHQTANVVNISRSPQDLTRPPLAVPSDLSTEQSASVSTPEPHQRPFGSPEPQNGSPRQPRLSPVGRIPAVVSRRDRDRKLPDNSFSRPFARSQPRPSVKPPGSVYSQIREMASPIESSSQPVSSTSTRSDGTSLEPKSSTFTNPPSSSTNRTSMDIHAHSEFFAFPPRKNSEQSYSTSSGHPSWMTALYTQPPQQEDIWNEYNDFMDEVIPLKTPKTPTTGSSLGAPFQYSGMLFDPTSTPTVVSVPPSSQLPPLPAITNATSNVLSVPQQISQFLQPSASPMTPDTLYGLIGGYGSRSTSTLFTQARSSVGDQQRINAYQAQRIAPPGSRDSVASSMHSKGSRHSRSTSLPQANARNSQSSLGTARRLTRDSHLVNIAEIPGHEQGASPSLRIGALMTSKWLSFGRVLFSPAHNETHLAHEPRVLVVDGLSSDWSYYVAMSYPTAEVYNLTLSMPGSPSLSLPDSNENPPPNHRQIPLASISTPFPFPKGFFTSVVFRFPKATTEQAYAACISECKRVLRPGGYLEVAVLDLDLMNMGTKARRAVRGLKTRMQQSDQEVCLRNLSDILVRQIGRRGFEAVQRCIVGVPAAGRIPKSQDMSSVSSDGSGKPVWHREARHGKSQEFSLADLLEDTRSNQFGSGKNNDETITKMVAKVGRWWYSTCYEKALLPTDQSIWTDPTLLRECEKQGTSFRLLICHAQKPTQTRRRTVSV